MKSNTAQSTHHTTKSGFLINQMAATTTNIFSRHPLLQSWYTGCKAESLVYGQHANTMRKACKCSSSSGLRKPVRFSRNTWTSLWRAAFVHTRGCNTGDLWTTTFVCRGARNGHSWLTIALHPASCSSSLVQRLLCKLAMHYLDLVNNQKCGSKPQLTWVACKIRCLAPWQHFMVWF